MNPESITDYIQSFLNRIEVLEDMNRGYRYGNKKLTEELTKAKEDIETLKYQMAILSGKVTPIIKLLDESS